MTGDIIQAAKFIGAGLSMIGALGGGIGIGLSVQGALEGMARNPDTYGNLFTNMILGIAFSEAIAIYCLVIAFLMLFVLFLFFFSHQKTNPSDSKSDSAAYCPE